MKKILGLGAALLCLFVICSPVHAVSKSSMIGVNVLVKGNISQAILADLGKIGKVRDVVYQINALTIQIRADQLGAVRARPYVLAANPDAVREGAPIDAVPIADFSAGLSTWNLDMINVTDTATESRTVEQDGTGVYVAVLDTGLLDSWRIYFPEERIASKYARCFGGGGGIEGNVSTPPNKWEHDQNSHGTHVTSTILGYALWTSDGGLPVNGVAPMATVIPVKVLNQNGSGWSSVIARGIMYVAELKDGPLAGHPVVINMSLGGGALDVVEKAAIDYAISKGVIIVASAGNAGNAGMGYPGAYPPVISVAAAGWTGEFAGGNRSWWLDTDVPEAADGLADQVYIAPFSSRAVGEQDLDVTAPGSYVVGPYQLNSATGRPSYYFLSGTSMASPHVAGIVALMLQKDPALTAGEAESALEESVLPLPEWGPSAAGAGLVDAAAALNALP